MKRIIFYVILLGSLCASCNPFNNQISQHDEGNPGIQIPEELEEEPTGYYILGSLPEHDIELCPNEKFQLITDKTVYQAPPISEPEPRKPFRDPVFGTCIIRVTDRNHDILDPSDDSSGMKNEYSRVQSFNADESLLLVRSTESFWYVYDVASFLPLGQVPAVVEPRWDTQDPYLLYYFEDTQLKSYDLSNGRIAQIREFADDVSDEDVVAVWTRYEGSPSFDTRYWGLMAQNSGWELIEFLIYDIEEDTVVIREMHPGYSVDHVTMSPLGNYFLASFDHYCERGVLGSDANPCGLMIYNRNLEKGRGLLRIIGHYDTGLDAAGREVIVYQDIDTDHISMLDLVTGMITPLVPIDFSHTSIGFHFSGRAFNSPGWALVSTYNGGHPQDVTWMDDSIFALELKANGRVIRLAHTQSVYDESVEKDYWAEPHASVNRDFTRIIFTSNWGRTGTEEVDLYMIILPEDWVTLLDN